MENPPIVGGSPEAKETAERELERYRASGEKPLYPWEPEKTERDLKILEVASGVLARGMEELGLKSAPVPHERVHLRECDSAASYEKMRGEILLNEEKIGSRSERKGVSEDFLKLWASLHEMVHYVGHEKFQVLEDGGKLASYRTGYRVIPRSGASEDSRMEGFNEAVVDAFVLHRLSKELDRVGAELGIDVSGVDPMKIVTYRAQVDVLEKVVVGVAEASGEDPAEVRDRIFKGHFTGEMMHLRDVERAFGPGSLEVLAHLSPDGKDRANHQATYDYFSRSVKN